MSRIMKLQYNRTMAIFALVLLLTISSSSCKARASRLLLSKIQASPVSSMTSSSQTLKGLQGQEHGPFNKVDSSFRRIPPSRSNPTQNKYKPPWNNYDQSTKQRRRLNPRPAL